VNGNLLDTNAALFTLANDPRLSQKLRDAISAGPNYLSVACYWEVLIKSMKGKLAVGDPRIWWTLGLKQLVASPLDIRSDHVERVFDLPPIHHDPFDRMLIAQAIAEGLTLVTTDAEIARYASPSLQVIF